MLVACQSNTNCFFRVPLLYLIISPSPYSYSSIDLLSRDWKNYFIQSDPCWLCLTLYTISATNCEHRKFAPPPRRFASWKIHTRRFSHSPEILCRLLSSRQRDIQTWLPLRGNTTETNLAWARFTSCMNKIPRLPVLLVLRRSTYWVSLSIACVQRRVLRCITDE